MWYLFFVYVGFPFKFTWLHPNYIHKSTSKFCIFLLIIKLINTTQEQQHVLYIPILNVKENISIWEICTVAIMVFAFTFTEIENPPFIRPSKVFKTFYQGKPNSFHVCRCEVRWSFKPQMLVHFSDDIFKRKYFYFAPGL